MVVPLRVALDATPLSVPTGGIRRYTEEVARALAAQYPYDSYYLVSDQPFDMPSEAPNLHRGTRPMGRVERRWWSIGVAREMRRLGVDVFHGTDFSVPYLPIRPAVMTIHDLSPWRDVVSEATSARVRRRTPWLLRMGLTTMVITPSETVRRDVMARFRMASNRVAAVPLAASGMFRPVAGVQCARPYFLCLGTLETRKNLRVVTEAWRELRCEADVALVVAGRGASDTAREEGVTYTGPLADDALPPLYSGALAFLFPSLYEGFGLPVVEAMGCGAMVIASKDPAVTESAGGAILQVDATDTRGWVEAMRTALDCDVRAAWRERGLARAAEFSWERTAMMTREVYDEARRLF